MTTSAQPPSPGHSDPLVTENAARDEMLAMLRADGLVTHADATLTPLTGGVSSEIYLVADGSSRFVVKRALAQLKTRDAWFADVGRNAHERAYLEYVGSFFPAAVPRVNRPLSPATGERGSEPRGYFAMEFLGDGFVNYKAELLAGRIDLATATRAMTTLATIHRRSMKDAAAISETFDTTRDFTQLRIEPYLLTTGERHPSLRTLFAGEAARLAACREALVHGDYSPKNMLVGHGRIVVLDCEVAWFGDPTVDVAFFLNHLLLKSLHHAPRDVRLQRVVEAAWLAYAEEFGNADEIAHRMMQLLPMLMLARVDGKSPVEYLDASKQDVVRSFAFAVLADRPADLFTLVAAWFAHLRLSST